MRQEGVGVDHIAIEIGLRPSASPTTESLSELIDDCRDPAPGGRQRATWRLGFHRHAVGNDDDGARCCCILIARHAAHVPRGRTKRRGGHFVWSGGGHHVRIPPCGLPCAGHGVSLATCWDVSRTDPCASVLPIVSHSPHASVGC
jgi:hypothetical protein